MENKSLEYKKAFDKYKELLSLLKEERWEDLPAMFNLIDNIIVNLRSAKSEEYKFNAEIFEIIKERIRSIIITEIRWHCGKKIN